MTPTGYKIEIMERITSAPEYYANVIVSINAINSLRAMLDKMSVKELKKIYSEGKKKGCSMKLQPFAGLKKFFFT